MYCTKQLNRLIPGLLVLLACFLAGISGCQQPVVDRGVPVTSAILLTAAKATHVAELAISAAENTLTAGLQTGVISRDTGLVFRDQIRPRIALSLQEVRTLLEIANRAPTGTTTEKILAAVVALQAVVAEVQSFTVNPAAWVVTYGGTP